MKMINDYTELAIAICSEDNWERAVKGIYKGTNCGASLQKIDNGVKVGSIVEGVDGDGTEYFDFTFPFDMQQFWETLTEVERQAAELWNEQQAIEEMAAWEEEQKYCPEDL